jgi:hypothetical protein
LTKRKRCAIINTESERAKNSLLNKKENDTLKNEKGNKTMTIKELLTATVEGAVVTAEMQEKAQAELVKMAAEAERRAQKAAEKRTSEDAPLLEKAQALLSDHVVRTAKDIGVALDVSTPKATALMRKLEGVKVTEVTVDKRIVKGYSL